MKKCIMLVLSLVLITGCTRSYDTLEAAVQSHWDTPIEIVNQDAKNQLVYYLDHTQHVLGVYYYENGRYRYNNKLSVGMRFTAESMIPFFVQAIHIEGVGNIIYGAIRSDEHKVETFVIEYKNGEFQEIKARNNTFIAEYPPYLTTSLEMFQTEIANVIAYDNNGVFVASYKKINHN
ncbi:hypothetical protein IM538_04070 [Cytobacillus suaedae]|nr:hypothetical protein IM538_04070 [Cytobacillus suaedae]